MTGPASAAAAGTIEIGGVEANVAAASIELSADEVAAITWGG